MARIARNCGSITFIRGKFLSMGLSQKSCALGLIGKSQSNINGKLMGRLLLTEKQAIALSAIVGEPIDSLFEPMECRNQRKKFRAKRVELGNESDTPRSVHLNH